MFDFALKKWFFDLWDHLLVPFVLNLALLAVWAGAWWLAPLAFGLGPSAVAALGLVVLTVTVTVLAAAAGTAWAFSQGERLNAAVWKAAVRRGWWPVAFTLGLNLILAGGFLFCFNGLLTGGGLPALAGVGLFGSGGLLWWLAQGWFVPLGFQLETRLGLMWKKAWLLTFDNPGSSLASAAAGLGVLLLSVLGLGLMPGLAGLALWQQTALKLRLYKYDWLKTQPEGRAGAVPWNTLLQAERDRLGKRTFLGMIFPWK